MGRPVMHFEIGCRDKARTSEFFSKLFDWNTQEMGPGRDQSIRPPARV